MPFVGSIVLLVFFCMDSTPGDNQFGANPKGIGGGGGFVGYGQMPPGYGQPQFGQPQPGYGQPQQGYGQPQPGQPHAF